MTPVRDSPAIPRLRSVNSYTNIRTATTTRNLNKSLQNLNLNEEGERAGARTHSLLVCADVCMGMEASATSLLSSEAAVAVCPCAGVPAAFSPGNLSTSSSASSTLGSPDNDEYILSFETIDKMRRVSSYSSLNSLIGNLSDAEALSHLTSGLSYASHPKRPASVASGWRGTMKHA